MLLHNSGVRSVPPELQSKPNPESNSHIHQRLSYREEQIFDFNPNGEQISFKAYPFADAEDPEPVFFRVGPLVYMPIREDTETITFAPEEDTRFPLSQEQFSEQLRSGRWTSVFGSLDSKVILSRAESDLCEYPITVFSASMIAAMWAFRHKFRDKLVIDAGAGSNPLLTATALNYLDASRCIMIENDARQSLAGNTFLRNQLLEHAGTYTSLCADLTDPVQLREVLTEVALEKSGVIVLANLGPWDEYGAANIETLRTFSALPAVSLIINGGYSFSEDCNHKREFLEAAELLGARGFRVAQSSQITPAYLTASR